jgi:ketol-acid reductoisomerase
MVGKRIITGETRGEVKKVLSEVQDGSFAGRWILENTANRPNFNARGACRRSTPSRRSAWSSGK